MASHKPRKIIAIDCETDPFLWGRSPRPFIWGAWDGKTFRHWEELGPFVEWLRGQHAYVYAHNGGKFDFRFLIHFIRGKVLLINGRIVEAPLGDALLRDSFAILPVPLRMWGKDDIEYYKMEAKCRHRHWDEILAYLESDCRYLYDAVSAFREEHGSAITLATAGFKSLLKLCGLERPMGYRDYHQTMRRWYYGGRVESRLRGRITGPIRLVDITSAFPWAMSMCRHPWGRQFVWGRKIVGDISEAGFYTVRCKSVGAFPHRARNGRISFPNDRTTRVFDVTGHELRAAMDLGIFDGTIEGYGIPTDTVAFEPFVAYWFARKRKCSDEGDAQGRLIAKLTLNSGYGKFGCDFDRHREYAIIDYDQVDEYKEEGWLLETDLEEGLLVSREPNRSRFIDVAVAASITGAARAKLLRAIVATERSGASVVYTDTDCLHVTGGEPQVELGSELGQWTDEGTFEEGFYGARKLYALRNGRTWKTACKGARLSAEQIREIALGKPAVWASDAPSWSLKSGEQWLTREISLDPIGD